MSARDAESGSSTYKGGSGRAGGLGNGGIGGGMGGGGNHGGGMGGGAGRNGGIGNQTGLTTGNRMIGGVAYGRPGGLARNPGAWGIAPTPPVTSRPLNRPAVPGLLNPAVPPPAAIPPEVPAPPQQPPIQGWLPGWPGTGMWWGDQPPYQNNPGLNPPAAPPSYANPPTWSPPTPGNRFPGSPFQDGTGQYDADPEKGDYAGPNFNGNKGYY